MVELNFYQTLAPYSPSYYQRGNRNRDRIPWRTVGNDDVMLAVALGRVAHV
jgi:hypothetical protein